MTGDDLLLAIQMAQAERPALIEEFLYQGDVLLLSGEPGIGKSIVAMQLVCQLTQGRVIFDFFQAPRPCTVYYLQLEGEPEQAYERLQRMIPRLGLNPQHLWWASSPTGLNLLDPIEQERLLKEIAAWRTPDLIVIDPLYQSVFGELSKELPSKAIIRFIGAARHIFKPCAVLLIHHTKKPTYSREGQRIEEADPYFGSIWLKAFVNTSYLLQPGRGRYAGDQVMLTCKKSRGGDVVRDLILHYDPETDTVSADAPFEEQSGYERVSKFLRELKKAGNVTNFFEVQSACKLSTRQLRYVQLALLKSGKLRCDKLNGHIKIWEPQ